MYVQMYVGPDPIVDGELSYLAVINKKLLAPCKADSSTDKYWASHVGFSELIRWLQATRGNGIIEAMAVSVNSEPSQMALRNATLLWEGLV